MRRTGRVLGVVALVLPLTFSVTTVLTAGGCSGSSGTGGQAAGNGEIDKAAQAKFKELLDKKPPLTGPGQKKKK